MLQADGDDELRHAWTQQLEPAGFTRVRNRRKLLTRTRHPQRSIDPVGVGRRYVAPCLRAIAILGSSARDRGALASL
jgi:hypothetical protein